MKRKSKKKTVDNHFARRCVQRLGYVPDQKELVRQIQENLLEYVGRQSLRVTHWKWTDPVHKIDCVLPYDKERKQIITVLFEDIYNESRLMENVEFKKL